MITFWQAILIAIVSAVGGGIVGAHDKLFEVQTEDLELLAVVNSQVCPTCPDCMKQCRSWGKWNKLIDTGLGSCKPVASPAAGWNFAMAYPGFGSLGKVSFWECGLMMFHNENGYTSPMSLGYDMGDCITIEPRECTQLEEDG